MASIQTAIQITDRVSAPMYNIIGALDNVIRAYDSVQSEFAEGFDTSKIQQARQQIDAAAQQMNHIGDRIESNTSKQMAFNNSIRDAANPLNSLVSKLSTIAGAYISIKSAKKVLDISDSFMQNRARIDLMNDGLQSTDELINKVYRSAQNARGSFDNMASVVARLGNNAKGAFSNPTEVIDFANLVQKQMKIAGSTGVEASNALLQLSQAMGSGELRGDELRAVLEQAPQMIDSIAQYIERDRSEIKDLAQDGKLTAEIVKNAMFASADEINQKFSTLPVTWNETWIMMKNYALMAFQPVLMKINEIANSPQFQVFIQNVANAVTAVSGWLLGLFDLMIQFANLVYDNWSIIGPVIYIIIGALAVYNAALLITNAITGISAAVNGIMAAAMGVNAAMTLGAATAQDAYNASLFASPLLWFMLVLAAVILLLVTLAQVMIKTTGITTSALGAMCGAVNVVIQFFKNLGLAVANIGIAIGLSIAAVASNMMTAFHNAIANIQSWFYNLLSTAITVVVKICEALNKLPFVKFDYSGISNAASDYASKAAAAQASKGEYKDIAAEFTKGMNTFDAFQGDWAGDAFRSGAAWGDGIMNKLHGLSPSAPSFDGGGYQALQRDIPAAPELGDGGKKAKEIADNTAKTADALSITNEELKYLRDLAEAEYVNKFTTAEIKIEQHNNNNISSDSDLDGIVDGLTSMVYSSMEMAAEGVY